jgi:sugar phosphate isomerase/epimerase
MIQVAVTVSLVNEARGGPFVFWDDLPAACATARRLGFDAIELFAPGPDTVNQADLQRMLDDHSLQLAGVGTGAGWVVERLSLTAEDAAVRRRAKDFVRSMIDFGGPFKAPAVIGSMQGSWNSQVDKSTALGYLGEGFEELAEAAAQHGVPLLYEPLNRYETNLINTIADGKHLLESLSTKNVRLLADLFHMSIEEVNVAQAIRDGAGSIGHIHFVDSNRRAAGHGHTDFEPIVAAIRDSHFDGYLSAEAFPLPDSEAAAQSTVEAFRKWFGG